MRLKNFLSIELLMTSERLFPERSEVAMTLADLQEKKEIESRSVFFKVRPGF